MQDLRLRLYIRVVSGELVLFAVQQRFALITFLRLLFVIVVFPSIGWTQNSASQIQRNPELHPVVKHDISLPLRSYPPAPRRSGVKRVIPNRPIPIDAQSKAPISSGTLDNVLQMSPGFSAPTINGTILGVGNGFTGPQGTWTVNVSPPDTVMDISSTYIVQVVNSGFAVFNKAGTVLYGPVNTNTLWTGFGSPCSVDNDGDGTINYDQIADRWVLAQFAVTTGPNTECIAVSTTNDPTGTWSRYAFSFTDFNDYPKVGIWPDGYYITYNMFTATQGYGEVCVYDRTNMITGAVARPAQCFGSVATTLNVQGLLPSDFDGSTLPPANSPNYVVRFGSDKLQLWKFHTDFTTPANTTFTGPTDISVSPFTVSCTSTARQACVPEPVVSTGTKLEALSDRLMNRLAYRNFSTYEALVVDHTIGGDSAAQVRWYELRSPNTSPTIFQQGTFAPDSNWRWCPSIAQDKNGNMAVGYSVSSSSLKPSIAVTGRLVTDSAGTMGAEATLFSGSGSQDGTYCPPGNTCPPTAKVQLKRWGDYSAMVVDPSDDCTFYYTTEYLPSDGIFNWSTRIGNMVFPSCTCVPPSVPTLNTVANNGNNHIDVSWSTVAGATQYHVYRSTTSGGAYTQIAVVLPPAATYADTTVSAGTTYYYVIRSYASCESSNSNQKSATAIGTCFTAPTFAGLSTVTNPGASNCRLDLAWSAATSNCAGSVYYSVYRSTSSSYTPSPANQIATGVLGTSFLDTSALTNGTTYYYIVRATDTATGTPQDTNTVTKNGTPLGPSSANTLFSQDFETGSGLNGWSLGLFGGSSAADWRGIQTCTNHTSGGSKIFRFGGTGSCTADYTVAGEFAFAQPNGATGIVVPAGSTNTTLSFWHRYQFESGFDGATLLLKLDASLYYFVPSAYITAGSYTGTTSSSNNTCVNGSGSIPVWTGSQATFINTTVDLEAMCNAITGTTAGCAGKTLYFAFTAITDCSNAADGWFLDDVQVTAVSQSSCSSANSIRPVGTLQASKITSNGSQISVNWTTTCSDTNYNIYYGNGSQLGSYTLAGNQCSISPSSGYTWSAPAVPGGESFVWWVIAGEDGVSTESSWGTNSSGVERHATASNVCGNTAKSVSTCP